MLTRVCDRRANLRAELHHGLVHLGLDLFLQQNFAALENFLDVGTQLTRLRIDDREFLLDPEREGVVRGGHGCAVYVSSKLRGGMRGDTERRSSNDKLTINVEDPKTKNITTL